MKQLKNYLMTGAALLAVLTMFAFKPIDFDDIKGMNTGETRSEAIK